MYNFKCGNVDGRKSCKLCDSKGNIWGNREDPSEIIPCGSNSETLCTPTNYTPQITGQKMTTTQIRSERQKRSTNNFKETVYGDRKILTNSERKYFSEKKGFKL